MSVTELKKALKEKKITFGLKDTIKKLKRGEVTKIFIALNCPKDTKENILHYARIANVEVIQLDQPNEELRVICKKPFATTVLSY